MNPSAPLSAVSALFSESLLILARVFEPSALTAKSTESELKTLFTKQLSKLNNDQKLKKINEFISKKSVSLLEVQREDLFSDDHTASLLNLLNQFLFSDFNNPKSVSASIKYAFDTSIKKGYSVNALISYVMTHTYTSLVSLKTPMNALFIADEVMTSTKKDAGSAGNDNEEAQIIYSTEKANMQPPVELAHVDDDEIMYLGSMSDYDDPHDDYPSNPEYDSLYESDMETEHLYGPNFLGNYNSVDAAFVEQALKLCPDIEMVLEPAMHKTMRNTTGFPIDDHFSLYVLKSDPDAGLGDFWKKFDELKYQQKIA